MSEYSELPGIIEAETNDAASFGGVGGNSANTGTPTEEDLEKIQDNEAKLSPIVNGVGVILKISLPASEWVLRDSKYVFVIESNSIQHSTVLHITGVNRGAMNDDIFWICTDGQLTFYTDTAPSGDIAIDGVMENTGDDWNAVGRIDAWPGAGLASIRYRHSLHVSNMPIAIGAGESVNVETPVDFGAAHLVMASPEWTGHTRVTIPRIYENAGRMCFTLVNNSGSSVAVSEVLLRVLYRGTISGLVTDTADDAAFVPYITDSDIDGVT